MKIKQILDDVENSSIPIADYFDDFPKSGFLRTEEIVGEIANAERDECDWKLEYLLIIADLDGLDSRYTEILCGLLGEKWHYSHEEIVSMLDKIKDPESAESIFHCCIDIPDHDEGRSLPKKCIWALVSINNEETNYFLNLLADHIDPTIAQFAKIQLES